VPKAIADLNKINHELTVQLQAMILSVKETIATTPPLEYQDDLRELRSCNKTQLSLLKQQCFRKIDVIDFLFANDEINEFIRSIEAISNIEDKLMAPSSKLSNTEIESSSIDSIFSPSYALRRKHSTNSGTTSPITTL